MEREITFFGRLRKARVQLVVLLVDSKCVSQVRKEGGEGRARRLWYKGAFTYYYMERGGLVEL